MEARTTDMRRIADKLAPVAPSRRRRRLAQTRDRKSFSNHSRIFTFIAHISLIALVSLAIYIAGPGSEENDMSDQELSQRPPTETEVRQASEAARALAKALTPKGLPFSVQRNGNRTEVDLSPALGQLVLDVLTHVARGEMVTFVPYGAELTTKEAADLLNVSRPFLVSMLSDGKIPFHKVGSHRRVRASDVLAFRAQRDAERSGALADLQRLGQEFDAD